jgi:hypothetical protein
LTGKDTKNPKTVEEEIKESANLMHYDTDNYILKSGGSSALMKLLIASVRNTGSVQDEPL